MRDKNGRFKHKEKNEVMYEKDYAVIWTVDVKGNKNKGYKVDIVDLPLIENYRWSVSTDGYAKSRTLKMHRLILGTKTGEITDHINQDKTDNRRNNLRIVSHSLNMRNSKTTMNKSGHKHIVIIGNKYSVQLRCRGKKYYVGASNTIEEAIKKRNNLYVELNYFEE